LKAFHLSVRAFAEFHRQFPASEYWIMGDGPERKGLERLSRQLGVAERVRFWGSMPRHEALAALAECDVLIHPTLHDSGGWVCLEAMAAGRPVICLDLGGPGLQVTDETGIKVPAISPDQAVNGLAQALSRLAADSALRVRLGTAGRQRVKDYFGWHEKGQLLATIYEGVVRDGCPTGC
jgi:glycosyltransferase involved in cell wall biosynthesis